MNKTPGSIMNKLLKLTADFYKDEKTYSCVCNISKRIRELNKLSIEANLLPHGKNKVALVTLIDKSIKSTKRLLQVV